MLAYSIAFLKREIDETPDDLSDCSGPLRTRKGVFCKLYRMNRMLIRDSKSLWTVDKPCMQEIVSPAISFLIARSLLQSPSHLPSAILPIRSSNCSKS